MTVPEYRVDFGSGLAARGRARIDADSYVRQQILEYEIDDHMLAGVAAGRIPAALLDLTDVFQILALADRRCRRTWPGDPRPPEQRLARRLIVRFPVRELNFWRSSQAGKLLERLVWQLSGDLLEPEFVEHRKRSRSLEAQSRLAIGVSEPAQYVTLASGGLDSLFGIIHCLMSGQAPSVLAASVYPHFRHLELQSRIMGMLRSPAPLGYAQNVTRLSVAISLQRNFQTRERSQKLRVLQFFSVGALAAAGSGLDRLIVAENGPGALNLPSSPMLGGSQLNRSMHPETLRLVSDLLSLALSRAFTIENVALFLTKRQMVAHLRSEGFGKLLEVTNSCDRFPYQPSSLHCGRCSSCLLRAAAVLDVPSLFDQLGQGGSRMRRLSAISQSDAYHHLVLLSVELDRVLSSGDPLLSLLGMDSSLRYALNKSDAPALLTMLDHFRQDVLDLQDLLNGEPASADRQFTFNLAAGGRR